MATQLRSAQEKLWRWPTIQARLSKSIYFTGQKRENRQSRPNLKGTAVEIYLALVRGHLQEFRNFRASAGASTRRGFMLLIRCLCGLKMARGQKRSQGWARG